jgi:hypothetical protein
LGGFSRVGNGDRAEKDVAQNLVIFIRDKGYNIWAGVAERIHDARLSGLAKGRFVDSADCGDTYVHVDCIRKALEDGEKTGETPTEAKRMSYLLGDGI